MTSTPQITFVCCVESGSLEAQTVRMVESLRRWGGKFAKAPVLAVTPRLGPPLTRKTLRTFELFNVEYLRFSVKSRYSWFKYLNKPFALAAAEERSGSECIAWLDSDLLFVGEPSELTLNDGEQFVACASDKNIGTTGPSDPFDAYWQKICNIVGIEIDDLPWITTEMEGQRIRLYWNSGLFVYRRNTAFGRNHLETSMRMLDAKLMNGNSGIFFTDQVALGLAMVKMRLKWRSLPFSHNYTMSSLIHSQWYKPHQHKEARIVHYHDCMWPAFWPEFSRTMLNSHKEVAEWLVSLGPMKNEAPAHWRAASKILAYLRNREESSYTKSCRLN